MRLIRTQDARYVFFCEYQWYLQHKDYVFGWQWDKQNRFWFTKNPRLAIKCAAWADDELRSELEREAQDLPDPTKAILTLKDGVFRYYSPYSWNRFAADAGFRVVKEPYWHWWTEGMENALRCYIAASTEIPDDFLCDEAAQERLRWYKDLRDSQIDASRAKDADISLPVPPNCALLPYQRAGVAYAKDRDRVLFGDQMRLGKTPQSIVWTNCDPSIKRVLVIVPATIKLNWLREWRTWSTLGLSVGVAWGFDSWPDTDVVVINAEILYRQKDCYTEAVLLKSGKPKMKVVKGKQTPVTRKVYPLRKEIRDVPWDVVIVDEGHRFKDEKTARYQCLSSLQPRRRAVLTGTPIPNRPVEIWPILHWLDPKTFPDKWKFAMRYAGAKKGPFGWDLTGASNLGELQDLLRQTLMVRRLRSQVLTELPPKRRQLIEFPCPDDRFVNEQEALWKRYTDLSAEVREAVEDSTVTVHVDEHREIVLSLETERMACFEEMSRVRHEDAVKRIPFVVAHLKELLEDEPKAICFAWHNDVVEEIAREFDASESIVIYGKTPQNQRVALQDRFNNDPNCKLCVISIAVCEGLDLSASSLGVMAEHDWVPKNIAQAEDRMENPFKKDSSLIQYLVFQGSLDAKMAQTLVYKEEIGYDALDRETAQIAEIASVATPESNPVVLPEKREAFGPTAPSEPFVFPAESSSTSRNKNASPALSSEDCATIHAAVRRIAGMCDGAFVRDNQGFNAMDVRIGHYLASLESLNPKTASMALSVLRKYRHTQLNGELEKYYE